MKAKYFLYIIISIGYFIIAISLLGNFHYIFDLFSHFYLQYFIIGIILFCISCYLKEIRAIILCLIVGIFLGSNIYNIEFPKNNIEPGVDIYYINANYYIDNSEELLQEIEYYAPQHIAIVELNENTYEKIRQIGDYNTILYHSEGVKSFGFFSKQTLKNVKIHKSIYPIGQVQIDNIDILIVHPLPPINKNLATLQKKHFGEIKDIFDNSRRKKKMILGDFNSTSYSQVFQKYFGNQYYKKSYTWKYNTLFSIPIDYALGSYDFFESYAIRSNISDHTPLVINIKN